MFSFNSIRSFCQDLLVNVGEPLLVRVVIIGLLVGVVYFVTRDRK